eukprot:CAMPEP_0198725720 /NCGR_PEP_ID=MMETSP1475-20131203/2969_1 /TAXON_ID= ORGANISM="Unidentified sp., Strain CCMP1999" /NCGR_SAMPLE_ID=MMETSP1475 /ASSEMBLY_ACC=CAM_ASM_001111 /LENGTH=166 /DNA_ID=CAMNT_0044487539 /DNA_START=33 /DNA_END=533 /DNA_ORIENTATION=+
MITGINDKMATAGKMNIGFLVDLEPNSPSYATLSEVTSGSMSSSPTTKKNMCDVCLESFNFKGSLLHHMTLCHGLEGIARCDECKLGFKRRSDHRKHILTVHEKYRPFPCNRCKASFYLKKDLTKHVSSVHEKLKPYQCDICLYKFGKKEHRTRHIRSVHDKKSRT